MPTAEAFFVTRTMEAMELLAFQPASAPQVAGVLRVHPGTARRLLNRLVADGWLIRSGGRRRTYTPTMRVVAMAAQLADRDLLPNAARPVVTRLHEETGRVAHLCIPSYRSALCLVHRSADADARPQFRELVPAHAAAAGKVLLAHRDAWRASVLGRPLPLLTAHTVVEPEAVEREAARTRDRGYAIDDEELQAGVRGVAVPVRGADRSMVAGLALSGPVRELAPEAVPGLVELLRARAGELEAELEAAVAS
jgi:IclR family transcriptional regulator, acetate operon repressor